MTYLSSSISNLKTLHLILTLTSILGLFYFEFTLPYLVLAFIFYFMYMGVGIGMTIHRFYTHKCFEFKYSWMRYISTLFAILSCRGSVLGWVYIHRIHHATSDSEKDPHSPVFKSYRVMFPHLVGYPEQINKGLVRDLLNREQVNIDKYYMLYILAWVLFLAIFGLSTVFFCFILPVTLTNIVWNSFTYYSHISGYRNYDTDDNSRNNLIYNVFLFGEGLHNNHHHNASRYDWKDKWYEFDIIGTTIGLIKK